MIWLHLLISLMILVRFTLFARVNEQVLYWLSGLTCTDENFVTKSGAQRVASKEGVALIVPDTSPSQWPIHFRFHVS